MYLLPLKTSFFVKNINLRFNKKYIKNHLSYKHNFKFVNSYIHFYIPFQWYFLLFFQTNKYYVYLYSNSYYIWVLIPLFSWNIFYDPNTRVLAVHNLYLNNYILVYMFNIGKLITSFNVLHFLKIKFKGKGYYIFKNKRNTITPQFGFAHRHYVYGYFISVKFRSKVSVILFSISYINIVFYSFLLRWLRPINIFTGRGVRFTKDKIFKKTGKISSYR